MTTDEEQREDYIMTAGNGDARYAALDERVDGQGRRITNLETAVNAGFQRLGESISVLGNEYRNSQRPQWQAIGVGLSAMIVLGGLLYWPIRENQGRADQRMTNMESTIEKKAESITATLDKKAEAIATNAVSVQSFLDFKATYENNRVVSRQDLNDRFKEMNDSIEKVRDDLVPRKELDRVWLSYDTQLVNERETRTTAIVNIQRQLDEIKTATASVYGQRDALIDLREAQRRLQEDIARIERERNSRTP